MKIIHSISSYRKWRESSEIGSRSIGFVPTMGALHEGHLSLVNRARKENELVVCSIFVNPTQFGPKEDLARYPRPFSQDIRLLTQRRVDVLFAPDNNAMYDETHRTSVLVEHLTNYLCGAKTSRGPQHFVGVATIVAKLFNLIKPHKAYFGQKDFQQLRIIEQMTMDLNFGIKIIRCPTVREADGLAMSSRNAYLRSKDRAEAPRIYAALQHGIKLLRSRPQMSPKAVCQNISFLLKAHPAFKIDYIEMVDPTTLQRLKTNQRPALLAVAAHIGKTRLIDNVLILK